jgi:hypothetical protein
VIADQEADVAGIEADGAARVNRGELSASDQALHGARVDVEERRDLFRGQECSAACRRRRPGL